MAAHLQRRAFLKQSALAAGSTLSSSPWSLGLAPAVSPATSSLHNPHFPGGNPAWRVTWNAALAVLAGNVRQMPRYIHPVLVEGSTYGGIWQECAPHEGLVYAELAKYIDRSPG
jgi:hypothetical protein